MGLVVSNISGSNHNGHLDLNDAPLIAVTGAITFGTEGALLPEETAAADVHFYVHDAAQFANAVYVDGALTADAIDADSLELAGDLTVNGNTVLGDDGGDTLVVNASAEFKAPVDMKEGLVVTGTLFISDEESTGGLIVEGDVEMENNVLIRGALEVLGATTLDDTVTINGATEITADGLVVTGGLYLDAEVPAEDFAGFGDYQVVPKLYIDQLVGGGFEIEGDAATTDGFSTQISGGDLLALSGTLEQITLAIGADSITFALTDSVSIVDNLTVGASNTASVLSAQTGSFDGDLSVDGDVTLGSDALVDTLTVNAEATFNGGVTIEGDLTVNGTTTTIDSVNVLIEDPFILLAKSATMAHSNGGIIILSGSESTVNGSPDGFTDLALGRVADDTWGVKRLNSLGGTVDDISDDEAPVGELVDFRARRYQVNGDGNSDGGLISFSVGNLEIYSTETATLIAPESVEINANGEEATVKLHAPDGQIVGCAKSSFLIQKHDGSSEDDWLTFDMANDDILPAVDNSISLGSLTNRFKNVYTGDLHLQNDRGSWTLIEEEDYITFRDNRTGRRFKMVMEDITGTGTYGPGNDGKL
jgi:predicted acyltransferase (DUF342 family)